MTEDKQPPIRLSQVVRNAGFDIELSEDRRRLELALRYADERRQTRDRRRGIRAATIVTLTAATLGAVFSGILRMIIQWLTDMPRGPHS